MKKRTQTILLVLIALLGISFPFYSGPYAQSIARTVLMYMALAISWDMLLRSGQISFGIAGIFGLGSYASVLAVLYLKLPPFVSLLFAGLLTAAVAALLGFVILRLRAMYFAITTLALGEIFRIIIRNWSSFTGGPEGKILRQVIFDGNSLAMYWLALGIAAAAVVASEAFRRTRIHFALTAIRNNETGARTNGIHIFKYLLIAFAVTSAIQGIAGGAYAQMYGFVTPESSFNADFTLLPLAMALLGGIYSTRGPVIGALLLGVVSEFLKLFIPYGHLVVYGIIIVIVILFMPQGIIGLIRRKTAEKTGRRVAV